MTVLVSNRGALERQYGIPGADQVEAALNTLIAADAARGVTTFLVYLDSAAMGAAAVTHAADPKQSKDAIDQVAVAHGADHIVIVGAPEVVPHVPLVNPAGNDGDANVPTDLPYACTAPYSNDAADFIAPTRSVSRIPGVTALNDPQYLVDLLTFASTHISEPASAFAAYLSVSADEWRVSTSLSLNAIFGSATGLAISPPDGPGWSPAQYGRKAQFFNLHGASDDSSWYGQRGAVYPIALSGAGTAGNIVAGTVTATEACYGAQLYDPSGVGMPICNVYLAGGCAGFFGSTTIAYGPAAANGAADLIAQYFLKEILSGRTIGDAALAARLQFVHAVGTLTPINLKTLAQFIVFGHGSLVPLEPTTPAMSRTALGTLRSLAGTLPSTTLVPRPVPAAPRSKEVEDEIRVHAVLNRMRQPKTTTYALRPAYEGMLRFGTPAISLAAPAYVHVTIDGRVDAPSQRDQFAVSVVEIVESGGAAPSVQIYYRH